jgi:geranylgeranyl pyrophosphate synthase
VVDLVREAGGILKAEQLRDRYTARAAAALDGLPQNCARGILGELPQHLFSPL